MSFIQEDIDTLNTSLLDPPVPLKGTGCPCCGGFVEKLFVGCPDLHRYAWINQCTACPYRTSSLPHLERRGKST